MKQVVRIRLHKRHFDPFVYDGEEFERILRNLKYREMTEANVKKLEKYIADYNSRKYHKYHELMVIKPETDEGWAELVQYIRDLVPKIQVYQEHKNANHEEAAISSRQRKAEITNNIIKDRGFKWHTKPCKSDTTEGKS